MFESIKILQLEANEGDGFLWWDRLLLFFSAIGTIGILGWLLSYSSYGFDFTDEGFYLVWMKNPFEYKWAYTQFGFLYHPLYLFLGGNISALRQANILLTFGVAVVLVNQFFKVLLPGSSLSSLQRWILSATFALSSLVVFDEWLLTPSYNSLALQAMFIATIGLLMVQATSTYLRVRGWVLVGVGGWLAFMAKPTTAVALGVSVLIFLCSVGKWNWRGLFVAIGVALSLLISTALVIDGSLLNYMQRLQTGARIARALGGGYTMGHILRLDHFHFKPFEVFLMVFLGLFSILASHLCDSSGSREKIISRVISAVFIISVPVILFGDLGVHSWVGGFHNLMLWSVAFSALFLGFSSYGRALFSSVPLTHKSLALLFVVLPHVYAFGSNNNYFQKGSSVSLFWLMTGLSIMGPSVRNNKKGMVLLPLALSTQLIVALLLKIGFEVPYRQEGNIPLNDHSVVIGQPGSSLLLSKGYAGYVSEVIESARGAGFVEGTPVIDLTGQSPGILYAMRAINIGHPWYLGGYPGSLKFAAEGLRLVSCEKIAKAWVLAEPGGPRSLPNELLANFGADLGRDYESVTSWKTPEGAGGYKEGRPQILFKPMRTLLNAVQACDDKKAIPQH